MTIEARRYVSFLLDVLKPRKVEDWELYHEVIPAGTELPMIDPQEGFYYDATDEDLPVVALEDGSAGWMSTEPFEQDTTLPSVEEASGDVLVAGLGLGFVSLAMAAKPEVRSVQHIELHREVVDLVWDQLLRAPQRYHAEKLGIQGGDVMEFLATTDERFDYIHLDIWSDTRTPIAGMRSAHELARRCLRPSGRAWTWLQENAPIIEKRLAAGPRSVGRVGLHPPCKACGKTVRADYGGLCGECAGVFGVTDMFIEPPGAFGSS